MQVEEWSIGTITPYEKNAKKHPDEQVQKIMDSIREFGFNQPIVVDSKGVIIVGHGRYMAAQLLDLDKVPVVQLDVSEDKAKSYRLADNKLNESEWDMDIVIGELKTMSLAMIDLSGFDRSLVLTKEQKKDDTVPAPPAEIRTQLGDLYELGDHRVLCGDSSKPEDVDRLLNGERPDILFTDPPYGKLSFMNARAEGAAKVGEYTEYANNETFEFAPLWTIVRDWECPKVIWGGNYFADILPITTSWIVWDKRAGAHSFFSDCEMAWTSLGITASIFHITWQGMIREGEHGKRLHPTQKPIDLTLKILEEYAPDVHLLVDLFLGSGSNLIACEKSARNCYGMELAPKYCDVIVQRWVDFTGKREIKKNGEPFVW